MRVRADTVLQINQVKNEKFHKILFFILCYLSYKYISNCKSKIEIYFEKRNDNLKDLFHAVVN